LLTHHLDAASALTVIEAARIPVLVLDHVGRIEYVNQFVEEQSGRPLSDVRGLDWFTALLPERDRIRARAFFQRIVDTDASRPEESSPITVVTALGDREVAWEACLSAAGAPDERKVICFGRELAAGTPVHDGAPAAFLDRAIEHLAEPHAILERQADGTWRVIAVNKRYTQLVRMRTVDAQRETLLGSSFDALQRLLGVANDEALAACAFIGPAIASRQPQTYETTRWIGSRSSEIEHTLAPVVDERGDCTHVVLISRDVSAGQRTEERLRRVQLAAKVGGLEIDLLTGTLTWSEEVTRMLELDPACVAATYDQFLALVHPDDRDFVRRSFRASLADRQPYEVVHRLLMPDGRLKWVDGRFETSYDAAGRPIRSAGTVQDVTDRVIADRGLHEARTAQQRLEAVSRLKDQAIEASINAIVLTDLLGTIGYVNRAFLRLWGAAASADITGRAFADLFADPSSVAMARAQLLATDEWSGELVAKRTDGSWFVALVSSTIIYDDKGVGLQLMSSIVDVTVQADARAAQELSEHGYRLLLEHSSDVVLRADGNGGIVDVNPRACEWLGCSREQLLGMRWNELLDGGREPRLRTRDGRLPVDLIVSRLPDGSVLAIGRRAFQPPILPQP
jgi:PAS domain S-box-containing protein